VPEVLQVARIGPPGLSDAQKREVWRRWKDGQSLSEIGRALGKVPGSIHGVVAANGGYMPRLRKRAADALTLAEREEISRGLAADESFRTIATRLGRAPSTTSREVGRHGGREKYRAANADERAWDNAHRPKPCLLKRNPKLRDVVAAKLAADRSPQQISGWLAHTFAPVDGMYVSHETIYRSLFIQTRGVLRKELTAHLRRRRTMRRSKNASTAGQQRGCIRDAVSIRERPAEAKAAHTARPFARSTTEAITQNREWSSTPVTSFSSRPSASQNPPITSSCHNCIGPGRSHRR
jgi:IS30 family transposase